LDNWVKKLILSIWMIDYKEKMLNWITFSFQELQWLGQGILKGKYHFTIDLLIDWFGIRCMTTDNFCFYLQNGLIWTSPTEVQYNDITPITFPLLGLFNFLYWTAMHAETIWYCFSYKFLFSDFVSWYNWTTIFWKYDIFGTLIWQQWKMLN
jgi:hypothetical protein